MQVTENYKHSINYVMNVGKKTGYPFVMAYLFTKNGVRKYCGSIDLIERITENMATCHAICHFYRGGVIVHKWWKLFGSYTLGNRTLRIANGKYAHLMKVNSRNKTQMRDYGLRFNGTRYVLIIDREVVRTWRKLPSRYLRDLDKIPK